MSAKPDYDVGIVGAGFAGLAAALRLKKNGHRSFVVFERAAEIGGTWRDNVYPGCACDVASPLYSFADAQNPDWSRRYSPQPEILAYLKEVVATNGLRDHIQTNADVVEARFLEEQGCWKVADRQGRSCTVAVLLLGMGPLNRPFMPQFQGLDRYKGRYFHSSQWDTSVDLQGKRVGVIGTGASAIQIVPSIAPEVAQLLLLQRTPAWVSYKVDATVSPFTKKLYRRFPSLLRLRREAIYWANEFFGLGLVGNKIVNKIIEGVSLWKLSREVKDPLVRNKLTPNYTIGCKRILLSDDYYPAFNRPNVALETAPIRAFTERGILTEEGREHPLDVVVFATGFVAADIELYTRILGLHGRNLIQEWRERGAEAYLGTTVAGYPNLGFILGPNTGLGHNSVIHMMESQMHYLIQYIEYRKALGPGGYLDVQEEEQEAYNQRIQAQFKETVWNSGCKSWYINRKGKNTTLYPGLTTHFRKETKVFDPSVYHIIQPTLHRAGEASVEA